MPLPVLQKSYANTPNLGGINPCNRVVFASAAQCFQDEWFAYISFMKSVGWECVGSCNGAAGAMDGPGTDRIVSAANLATRGATTTAPQSWWIGKRTDGGMGGAKVMFAYEGGGANQLKISVSVGAGTGFTLAGTPTHQPTDAEQIIIQPASTPLDGGAASLDRLWSGWCSTDGSILMWAIARNNVWTRWIRIALNTPTNIAPSVWNVPIIGFSTNAMGHSFILGNTPNAIGRVNGTGAYVNNVAFYASIEGYRSSIGPAVVTFAPEAQGGDGLLFWPIGWFSEIATVRGKWGNAIDLWAGVAAQADGDTYPASGVGLRQFICMGGHIVPWDGTALAPGTVVVMI